LAGTFDFAKTFDKKFEKNWRELSISRKHLIKSLKKNWRELSIWRKPFRSKSFSVHAPSTRTELHKLTEINPVETTRFQNFTPILKIRVARFFFVQRTKTGKIFTM
jgi:hypothetical protein